MPTLYCRKLLRIRWLVRTAVRRSAAGLCTSLLFVKQFCTPVWRPDGEDWIKLSILSGSLRCLVSYSSPMCPLHLSA
jgi:hypothetical protein